MPLRESLGAVGRIGGIGVFALRILGAIRMRRGQFGDTVRQIYVIGARSVPIVAFGGAFVGLVMALQGYRTLEIFGASSALGTAIGVSLYRELGPVLTAILFAGRAGSAMAAELGLMRATDQINALSMMAIDPVQKVVVPRFLAGVISVPLLTAVFCAFAILGAWFQAVLVLEVDAGFFWSALMQSVDFKEDLSQALVKAVSFGTICSLLATYVGYHAEPTIEGTSVATTRAVVHGSLMVLFLDFVLSALLF
ncbi:MAG TPA: MlaE family lipid ABC transporter permease subunit [Xanthomonadaceae bacterium]|nr:MlaE family lipid ABC transporter permease subunit [Xanthomonadaceae bacterium]